MLDGTTWYTRDCVVFEHVVHSETLDRIRTLKGPAVMLMAAFFGSVRLLDNVELNIVRVEVKPRVCLQVAIIIEHKLIP